MAAGKKLNVGFLTTVSGRWPRELPRRRHADYRAWLRDHVEGIELTASDDIVATPAEAEAAVEAFRRAAVDVVVVLLGAFTGDMIATRIGEQLNVPVILWALREPRFDGGRLMSNVLVAATMNSAALKRLGLTGHFVYGGTEEERAVREVRGLLGAYRAIKSMRRTFLGLIGYRPTGFYSSTFDETLIRKTFGTAMEAFDLVHIANVAAGVPDAEVDADVEAFRRSLAVDKDLPEEYLRNHSRAMLAFRKVIADNGFDALVLRCWPELGQMKCTPCALLSRFADEGFLIGCEADVDATLTMLLQHYLAGSVPFMCDLVQADEKENTALFWHCGQAARKLHDGSDRTLAADHSLAGQGVVIEGTLKPGAVTVSLLSQVGGKYKLLVVPGRAVATEKEIKGVMVRVKTKSPVLDVVYGIVEHGFPHHYSIVWADLADDLKRVAGLLGIEVVER